MMRIFSLDRLIGIGVGADGDDLGDVAGRRQFLGQQLGGIGLGEQARFEIGAGRHAEIGVGRAREAVDAAMLAAAIGIDRLVERDVRRLVAGDDGAGGVADDLGAQGGRGTVLGAPAVIPAVVDQDAFLGLVAPHRVGKGAAAPQEPPVCGDV
ncbi:MAG: hypothetical protein WDN08_17270 [Rhizomicrobium sp.]